MLEIRESFPLVDDVLDTFAPVIGADFVGYRNHVLRVLNYYCALAAAPRVPEPVLIAAAFHDVGIWTDGTFDYLEPSIRRAVAYNTATRAERLNDEVRAIIAAHHKLRRYRAQHADTVECFRRADLIDVSLGTVRCGLPAAFIRELRTALPSAGFHSGLVARAWRQFLRSPLRPLPMLRW